MQECAGCHRNAIGSDLQSAVCIAGSATSVRLSAREQPLLVATIETGTMPEPASVIHISRERQKGEILPIHVVF